MSSSPVKPWSHDPNAPQISYELYLSEKYNFAGTLISAMLYGIVILLFFRCVIALLNPVNRGEGGVKWALMAHTAALFSLATIFVGMNHDIQSISYVDYRETPRIDGSPPGPLGYQLFINSGAISVIPNLLFPFLQWLADGLLLYRCYVICGMNKWIIVFPSLLYLASVSIGILFVYETLNPLFVTNGNPAAAQAGLSYFWLSLSVNVILTLTIVIRLVLHNKEIRNAIGARYGASGMYNSLVTMLLESCALYALSSILYIGLFAATSSVTALFFPIHVEVQVIAPFLITLRVANRTALTSKSLVSADLSAIHFESRGKVTDGDETLPSGTTVCTSSMDVNDEPKTPSPDTGAAEVHTAIEEVPS